MQKSKHISDIILPHSIVKYALMYTILITDYFKFDSRNYLLNNTFKIL